MDVGAYDPITDSVSLAFYEHGWRGIHVEPIHDYAQRLREARPDELVVEAAASCIPDQVDLFEIEDTGMTTGVASYAELHRNVGWKSNKITVPTRTLASVLEDAQGRDIHWLKLDVEGMERDALESWGSSTIRPWILVIESTYPNSPEVNYKDWEQEVLKRGYVFAYFDGLNRFYVHKDHSNLLDSFGPGPNFFDTFSLTDRSPFVTDLGKKLRDTAERTETLETELKAVAEKLRLSEAELGTLTQLATQREADLTKALSATAKSFEAGLKSAVTAIKAENRERISLYQAELGALRAEIVYLRMSGLTRATVAYKRGVSHLARASKEALRPRLEAALVFVRRHPVTKPAILALASAVPPIKRKMLAFGQVRPDFRMPAMEQSRARVDARRGMQAEYRKNSARRVGRADQQEVRVEPYAPGGYPLLSICITTYNRASWLKHSLQELLTHVGQFGDKVEVLVCDNASEDETPAVVSDLLGIYNFTYVRNPQNVGMLGNLGVTAGHARGKYVWILGDDDIVVADGIRLVLDAIERHPETEIIYTNYSYTNMGIKEAGGVEAIVRAQVPIAEPTDSVFVRHLWQIAANTDNFFTAIYCCIFRKDHAVAAYTQNTKGDPFTSLLTCVPTTNYVLNHLLERPAYWIGSPVVVVNMNVSWMRYADLWVLERFPEMYQKFEMLGVPPDLIDRYRTKSVPGVVHYLREALQNNSLNLRWITLRRLFMTYKHIAAFQEALPEIKGLIEAAKPGAALFDLPALDDPFPGPVIVEGPFVGSYSLAIVNRAIASNLRRLGGQVALGPSPTEGDNFSIRESQVDATTWSLYRASQQPDFAPSTVLRYTYPITAAGMAGDINLYHSFGWEESSFDLQAIDHFNESLDGITVMSTYVRKILLDHGLRVPVLVTGLGVDHLGTESISAHGRQNSTEFTFLHISSCFPRKGLDVLLEAYVREFSNGETVKLVIKTFPNPHNDAHALVSAYQANGDCPTIVLINEDWEGDGQISDLYGSAQVVVAPSRGEGFGLTVAEALFAGVPVITTGHGGHMDMLGEDYPWLIDYMFEYAGTHFGLTDSYWAEPSVDDLRRLLRQAFETSADERMTMVNDFRERLLSKFRWSHVAKRTVGFLEDLRSNPLSRSVSTHVRLGVISSWNTRCGIAEYVRNLVSHFVESDLKVYASQATPTELTRLDDCEVLRTWKPHDVEGLGELVADDESVDVLVIQHQPSFMSIDSLAEIVDASTAKDKRVVIFLHNANNFCDHLNGKNIGAFRDLRVHIYVHSVNDLNLIKSRSPFLLGNATLFPHGVVVSETESYPKGQDRTTFEIGTFGFLLPHKGIENLIRAMSILNQGGSRYRLHLYTSALDERSQRYALQCKDLIEQLGLVDSVIFRTDFIPGGELQQLLSSLDLIVLAYQHTTESSSAAVRTCLTSGTPVLCSPLSIFDDVQSVVDFLPSTEPEQIASCISERAANPGILLARRADQLAWVGQHSWNVLSKRFFNVVMQLGRERHLESGIDVADAMPGGS